MERIHLIRRQSFHSVDQSSLVDTGRGSFRRHFPHWCNFLHSGKCCFRWPPFSPQMMLLLRFYAPRWHFCQLWLCLSEKTAVPTAEFRTSWAALSRWIRPSLPHTHRSRERCHWRHRRRAHNQGRRHTPNSCPLWSPPCSDTHSVVCTSRWRSQGSRLLQIDGHTKLKRRTSPLYLVTALTRRAECARPATFTEAVQWLVASSMLATGQCGALGAVFSLPAFYFNIQQKKKEKV